MYNQIRKVPYVASNGRGGITYFAGGFQNQVGIESQIIAAICRCTPPKKIVEMLLIIFPPSADAVLAFAAISLIKVPEITDPKKQQFAVFLWSGVLLLVYSLLLSIFRTKNGGYPFWLPPF